jgi:hypothetical protein
VRPSDLRQYSVEPPGNVYKRAFSEPGPAWLAIVSKDRIVSMCDISVSPVPCHTITLSTGTKILCQRCCVRGKIVRVLHHIYDSSKLAVDIVTGRVEGGIVVDDQWKETRGQETRERRCAGTQLA